MLLTDSPATEAGLSTTLAHTIKLDRTLSRVHDLSDEELEQLNRDLLTHLAHWINGKERDVHGCCSSISSFTVSHHVGLLETAWYLQLVREGVSDFLARQDLADAGEVQARANRFFDRLVCEVLRG